MVKPSTSGSSPLSPTRWPAEAFNARAILTFIGVVIAAVGVGMVFTLLAGAIYVAISHHRMTQQSAEFRWFAVIGQAFLYVPIAAAIVIWLPRSAHRSLRELGLHVPTVRDAGAGIAGAIGMYIAVALAAWVQFGLARVKAEQSSVKMLAAGHDPLFWIAFAVLAVVLAPIVEELIFRGFIFNALLRYTPVWFAAIGSGVLFGLGHFEPTAALPLACGGIVLALVYYRTGSLAASMMTHATFNLVNVIAVIVTGGNG